MISLVAAFVAACGGSGGDGDDGAPVSTDTGGIEISGKASAPAGVVARLEQKPLGIQLADIVFSPAYGGITGLQPVPGATVELIRIDNAGNPVGDVLATTSTSTTGDYTLTLPTGVDLSGDLVVRITGSGGLQMRAQVVEVEVDIDPLTEFVLNKFIESDSDLATLPVGSVAKLKGHVDEFDLTASANLSTMLAQLESEVGGFVNQEIASIGAGPGDASGLTAAYRLFTMDLTLHDDDGRNASGDFGVEQDFESFNATGSSNGSITTAFNSELLSYSLLGSVQGAFRLNFVQEQENLGGAAGPTLTFDTNRVMTGNDPFEEQIDGDFGFRSVPTTFQLQQAGDNGILVGNSESAIIRYRTVEVDGNLAVDPNQRDGDEIFRGLNLVLDTPTNFTGADLTGSFGLVTLEITLRDSGSIEVFTEKVPANINAVDIDILEGTEHSLSFGSGSPVYSSGTAPAEDDLVYTVDGSGNFLTIGGEAVVGAVDADAQLLVIAIQESTPNGSGAVFDNATDATYGLVLGVRQPAATAFFAKRAAYLVPLPPVDISNNRYRVFFVGTGSDNGTDLEVNSLGFASTLQIGSFEYTLGAHRNTANAELHNRTVSKSGFAGEVERESSFESALVDVTLGNDGSISLELLDPSGDTFLADGWLSEDGSIAVMQARSQATGDNPQPNELGLLILTKI